LAPDTVAAEVVVQVLLEATQLLPLAVQAALV
jgi:hypothetical protein